MGCDGGTIPRRDELVKVKKKAETKDKDSELCFQWRCCSITQQPLQKPIVTCGLGKLYNKLSLVEALLNKSLPESASHIKNLKDFKELNLTPNPTFKDDDVRGGGTTVASAPYICPVIGLEMSGKFRFVALWGCGCVFSERALKQVNVKNCHKCQQPFTEDDVVVLNGNKDDLEVMTERMLKRKEKNKNKKDKKSKIVIKTEDMPSTSKESDNVEAKVEIIKKEPENVKEISASKLMASSSTKRPGRINNNGIDTKKIKKDYSVAKDPEVSDVYKSLFTTHKSEKEQNRAHWVTYNPFYN